MKKIFTLLLVLALCVSTAVTAFAAENANEYNTITEAGVTVNGKEAKVLFENDEYAIVEVATAENAIMPRDTGFGYEDTSVATSGDFTVYTPYSGTLYGTFKVEAPSSSSFCYMTLVSPSGSIYKDSVYVDCDTPSYNKDNVLTDGQVFKITNASSGTYTVRWLAYPASGSTMRMLCWLYK